MKDHGASRNVFARQWLVSDGDGGSRRLGAPADYKIVGFWAIIIMLTVKLPHGDVVKPLGCSRQVALKETGIETSLGYSMACRLLNSNLVTPSDPAATMAPTEVPHTALTHVKTRHWEKKGAVSFSVPQCSSIQDCVP